MNSRTETDRNKKKLYLLCVFVLAAALLISGVSLAFFSGRDVVTNKQQYKSIEIQLMEIRWEETGKEDAGKLQPGMVVEKDPCVYNSGDADVYVRMKLLILNGNGEEIMSSSDSEEIDRYVAILEALYCKSGDTLADHALFNVSENAYSSGNTAFEYKDGWFYYKTDGEYTVLKPGTATPTLFDCIKIPELKAEYNGVFDSDFKIEAVAQAVSAEYDADEVMSAFTDLYDN